LIIVYFQSEAKKKIIFNGLSVFDLKKRRKKEKSEYHVLAVDMSADKALLVFCTTR
jgi:hypothetical protein